MWIVWLEKKILKTLGIILGLVLILITALHFYVVNNAESLLEGLVANESNNKLRLKVKNIKFNYFSKKVELENVSFFSNDSLELKTSYNIEIENIRLKVKALLPIFTRKELLIDSIYLTAPWITVTRLKPASDSITKKVSIPEEMGRIYNSIINASKLFQVTRFEMNEGKFTLINKVHPDQLPLTVSNLHIHIDNLKIDSTLNDEKLFFSDQMLFRTTDQDIIFPDGNHRLAFSKFRINIRRKFIQIDSCTLIGKKPGENNSEFKIFLDTLRLVNVDFKALYERELIKADTVFCRNPLFNIKLELSKKGSAKNKLPNLDTLIQELTGDLLLNYISVTNAGINITTYRNGNPTSFSSDQNNFEMKGLSIDQNRSNPVMLEGFDMAIHNYENFVKDSSYFLRFDSIRLRENRILLSNFSVNTEAFKDSRNIKVQQFALSGLSWNELLFNRRIKAQQATLINPDIDYTQPEMVKGKNTESFISSLDVINRIMSLEKLQMINGQIRIRARDHTEIQLQNTDLLLNSREVVKSPTAISVERSVEELNFSKGLIKLKNILVNMENAFFDGKKNRLIVGKLNFYNPDQSFNVLSKNTFLGNIQFDDSLNIVTADTVNWEQARIEVNIFPKEIRKNNNPVIFDLKMLSGSNTQVDINSEINSISFNLKTIKANSFSKKEKINAENLNTSGINFSYISGDIEIKSDSFAIHDLFPSLVTTTLINQKKGSNSLIAKIPEASFIPDINSIIYKNPIIKSVKFIHPEITISTIEQLVKKESKSFPALNIDQLDMESPVLILHNSLPGKPSLIHWDGRKNKLKVKNIFSDKVNDQISISSIAADLTNFSISNSTGKNFRSKDVELKTNFENLVLKNGEKINWSVKLNELFSKNYAADSLNKKPVQLKIFTGKLEGVSISSENIKSIPALVKANPGFIISDISGYLIDEKKNIGWQNLVINNSAKTISVDSFSFNPVMDRDAFIAADPFQTDYLTFNSGKIQATKFDLNQYLSDSIVRIGELNVSNPYFTSYRDKRPPFKAGIIKPLPSKLIQKIPFPVSIDTVNIINGKTVYFEVNDKNNETGIIPVTRISGDVFPVKNFDLTKNDSLRIRLNGYLLDSAWIRLRTRESYSDSLSGFQITLRMRPRSLLYLNEILEPLALVNILSGELDTLLMRAIANDQLSLGEMRMFYHDLKVKFLRNSTEDKKRFLTGLMTFIANSFVIKNKNTKRVGIVYFPRIQDRSFINYYIKIAMSGMASSVGAKKNKRLLRKYKKQLKIRQLPPIDFD